jgi:chromosome segregation ATPase
MERAQAELERTKAEAAKKIEAVGKDRDDAQRHRDALAVDIARTREELEKQTTQTAAAVRSVAVMREEFEKIKAERGTWDKQISEVRDAHRLDSDALRKAQAALVAAEQKMQAEISRVETAHHNAATALAEERKRIEGFRDQVHILRREKKLELNAMADNFHGLMRERENSMAQIREEMARLREETARAATERDEAVRKAEAHIAGARELVAGEVAELKRQLEETRQRVAQLSAERDALKAERDEMMRLPSIRPMSVTPPGIGSQPPV